MARDKVTLVLSGDVRVSDLAQATTALSKLIDQLGQTTIPGRKIEWIVDNLQSGSAIMSLRGILSDEEPQGANATVEKVVRAYEDVGRAAIKGTLNDYPLEIQASIVEIASVINHGISSVRFETDEYDAEIIEVPAIKNADIVEPEYLVAESQEPFIEQTYGAVRGRVQSLSNRGQLQFTLYDVIDDHPISCYLAPGYEKKMKDVWGKLVIVEGLIRRSRKTGLASVVRKVSEIKIFKEKGSYRDALGAVPRRKGEVEMPEDIIRRMRDDE